MAVGLAPFPANPSQLYQNRIVCYYEIKSPEFRVITGFLPLFFPLYPFQLSRFGTFSTRLLSRYLPARILQNKRITGSLCLSGVSPSFDQALAQFLPNFATRQRGA